MTWFCPALHCTNQVEHNGICDDCLAFLPVVIDEIGGLWPRAHTMLAPGTNRPDVKAVSNPPGSRPPLNLHALHVIDTTFAQVIGWATTVRIRESMEPAHPATGVVAFHDAQALLAQRYATLANSMLLTGFYNDMYTSRRVLVQLAGDASLTRRLTHPCFICGMTSLISRHGGDYIACLTCNARWGQSAYRALLRVACTPTGVTANPARDADRWINTQKGARQ